MHALLNIYSIHRHEIKLAKFYDRLAVTPDLTKKYIYVALHYQPELTTSPIAGVFVDQLLIVQMLAYLLPPDVHLYVKEHPNQKALARSFQFYEGLKQIPQVTIVPKAFNSFQLIQNCIAIATATGTVGWEGLFRGKPVILFGNIFYQYANGVFRVKTREECQQALEKILAGTANPALKDIKLYLKALESVSIEAYSDVVWKKITRISDTQNVEHLKHALEEKIQSILG